MNVLKQFDTQVTRRIAQLPKSLKKPFHRLGLASQPPIWVVVIVLFSYATGAFATLQTMLILIAVPLGMMSKFIIRRKRPPTIYAGSMRVKSYSFPSSHALTAALATSYITLTAPLAGIGLIALSALLALLAAVIGVSRVYLGAHYPSDVLAGWIIGITIAASIITLT